MSDAPSHPTAVAAQDTALLDAVFEAAVDAIIVSDVRGRITRANRAAGALFGHEAEELVGRSLDMLMPPAVAREHDGYIRHHLETGEKQIIGKGREVRGRRKDGSEFPLHLAVGRASVGGAPVFIGILHDLTRRKAAEEALARSQRLDAVGQMTGGIAHDFNNLLTIIMGNLELLDMSLKDERDRALLSDALEAAALGSDLTSRLLGFARRIELNPVRVAADKVCTDCLGILRRTLGPACRIETRFAEDLPEIEVDASQMQTALMNLALNAKDAMPDGGRLVFETALAEIDDDYLAQETGIVQGRYVRVSVSDTGHGMSAEVQRRVFEPFFTTKTGGTGNGFGLSMVYAFLRQSGGHVTLYSEEGRGATFNLYFPVAAGPDAAPLTRVPRAAGVPTGSGQLVLVVEDDAMVRRLSVERLQALGYATREAANGEAAIALLRAGDPVDLVFTDLVMDGSVNGYALALWVTEHRPGVPVLLTSGYAQTVLPDDAADAARFPLIQKPFRQSDLADALRRLLFADQEPSRSTSPVST